MGKGEIIFAPYHLSSRSRSTHSHCYGKTGKESWLGGNEIQPAQRNQLLATPKILFAFKSCPFLRLISIFTRGFLSYALSFYLGPLGNILAVRTELKTGLSTLYSLLYLEPTNRDNSVFSRLQRSDVRTDFTTWPASAYSQHECNLRNRLDLSSLVNCSAKLSRKSVFYTLMVSLNQS